MTAPVPFQTKVLAYPEMKEVKPSNQRMKIVGLFNPGATTIKEGEEEKMLLMVRKAEQPIDEIINEGYHENVDEQIINRPVFRTENRQGSPFNIETRGYKRSEIEYFSHKDIKPANEPISLRHISYPEIMVYDMDGNLERVVKSNFYPQFKHEESGMEDIRLTKREEGEEFEYLGEKYKYIGTYVPPHHELRVGTAFFVTNDFKDFKRISPSPSETPRILLPEKDVAVFPRKIPVEDFDRSELNAEWALTRPSSYGGTSKPDMSVSNASVVSRWSTPYRLVYSSTPNSVASGPGGPPIELDGKWFLFYHRIRKSGGGNVYTTHMMGLNLQDPRIMEFDKPNDPIIRPNQGFDRRDKSYIKDVDYSMGSLLLKDGQVTRIISGGNDECTLMKDFYTEDLVSWSKK